MTKLTNINTNNRTNYKNHPIQIASSSLFQHQ